MSEMTYEYNHATGEENVREANEEELELLALGKKGMEERLEIKAEMEAKKSSARAKLMDLGLDEEEVKAFLG